MEIAILAQTEHTLWAGSIPELNVRSGIVSECRAVRPPGVALNRPNFPATPPEGIGGGTP